MGFLKDCFTAFMLGYNGGNYKGEQIDISYLIGKEPKPTKEVVPGYILQQLEALTDQIETNNAILYHLDHKLLYTYDNIKVLELEKKRHKLAYDTARMEEKRYKLINKYNLGD